MDELELLKKDWKRREESLPKLSFDEIYKMIWKKSSTTVQWIFAISVLEFVLWISIDIYMSFVNEPDTPSLPETATVFLVGMVLFYGVLLYFIFRFYKNYTKIKATDSVKLLIQNILQTRKTVGQYVFFNLSFLAVFGIGMQAYLIFFTDKQVLGVTEGHISVYFAVIIMILSVIIVVGVVALLYYFIYGMFTKRLKRNYKDLKKLDT